jgi:bacteriocin leader peptide (microcyclamide/patellamide family)
MQQKSLCNSSPSSPASPNRLLFTKKKLTTLSGQRKPNEETQMNNKSITPNPQQPVDRVPTGQLPSALAELSEAALVEANVLPSFCFCCGFIPEDEEWRYL